MSREILDTTFDNDGIIIGPAETEVASAAIQWDGKIVVAGNTTSPIS